MVPAIGEELGRTTHIEKIKVNNLGKEENCLRGLHAVCVGGAVTEEHGQPSSVDWRWPLVESRAE